MKPAFDLTLYLVTDSSLLPPGRTLVEQVTAAIAGGCTLVQLREKTTPTRAFIALAREIHAITRAHNIPLLINDRIDVALAVDCEGVHVGWDDCEVGTARKILGPGKIIGLSISDMKQAEDAARSEYADEIDYIGLGPVFATQTKKDHNPPLGINGAREVYEKIPSLFGRSVPVVVIGGINLQNIADVVEGVALQEPDGCAIVSAIMASPDSEYASRQLLDSSCKLYLPSIMADNGILAQSVVPRVFANVAAQKPIIHHITNSVVKEFSANICLSLGASPIMSDSPEEAEPLVAISSALLLNMGTLDRSDVQTFQKAITANATHQNPIIFDPVGVGATPLRKETAELLLRTGNITVLKGNESEIRTIAGEDIKMRGVDSAAPTSSSDENKILLIHNLAKRFPGMVVVMSGERDLVADGTRVWELDDGSRFQPLTTGTGCGLGTCIAVAVAANRKERGEIVKAVLAAVMVYNAAARMAAGEARGPGSWRVAFGDWLWRLAGGEEVEGVWVSGGRRVGARQVHV